VKLPVTDLSVSAAFYQALLELTPQFEFAELGQLRGVQLINRSNRVTIALRLRDYCASRPVLDGFDVVSFAVDSRDELVGMANRCDAHGLSRTEIVDTPPFVSIFDVHDPDGTVLRFAFDHPEAPSGWVGVDIAADGPRLYQTPQLDRGWLTSS